MEKENLPFETIEVDKTSGDAKIVLKEELEQLIDEILGVNDG
jgi:hypothetical protein